MKFALQKSPIPESRMFIAKELIEKHFDATWHAHGEYQLFLVLKGTGTRFIGNTVKSFDSGDLTFLGPNMPHLWRNDSVYFEKSSKRITHGLVIYFRAGFLGELLEKEEMGRLRNLFAKAKRGLEFYRQTVEQITGMMKQILTKHGAQRLIQLLQILEVLTQSKECRMLHNADYKYQLKESETQRINLVYNYAAQHFHGHIALNDVAGLLNMTPTSFSRYFRMKTSKSFSDFISELRIRHACKLLIEDDTKTVSQVSYECGFNTLSNFNRQFRLYIKMNPKSYRQQFSNL